MGYYEKISQELSELISKFEEASRDFDLKLSQMQETKKGIIEMAKQRQKGFPWLAKAYNDLFELQDREIINFLKYKDKPAIRASEIIKEYSKLRRQSQYDKKIYQYLIEYYTSICPFLTELDEEVPLPEEEWLYQDYSEEEAEDMATRFLTKEEYRKLSVSDRNQLALDRYWSHRKRSKWLLGKMYERFIGYLYEQKGYQVEYFGIKEKYKDLGRDLIAKKGKEIYIIQCKNWSKFKTIYENHIFQLFGTTFEYNERNKAKAKAVFFTTTKLSDIANEMCNKLGILLMHNFPLKVYPSVKCNVSRRTGEKIYHLPFDQQYDKTLVEEERLEKYVARVAEAERLGFRRAFRWLGDTGKK